MINYVQGDITLSDCKVLVHGVAPGDHFNQGLALELRKHWPMMFKDFRHYCNQHHPKEGEIVTWGGVDGTQIVHLLTQIASYDHGKRPGYATLKNVNHSLKSLRTWLDNEEIEAIAMPRLATGVGHLDWNDVKPLIEKHLGDAKTRVDLYELYHKGHEAEPV